MATTPKKTPYLRRLIGFYFRPTWQSLFPILYLLFFGYFTVFYSGNLWIAFKFLFYTFVNSTELLGLSYLFWGVLFVIALMIPFFASIYAIALLYEIWKDRSRTGYRKFLITVLIILGTPLIIILMDGVIRIVAAQPALYEFVVENNLNISGITF